MLDFELLLVLGALAFYLQDSAAMRMSLLSSASDAAGACVREPAC